jgi:hypothetical protein
LKAHQVHPMVTVVLNVAEKPSVARALAGVFGQMPGVQDRGMRRDGAQIFTHEGVKFPNVFSQGQGIRMQGPCTFYVEFFLPCSSGCWFVFPDCRKLIPLAFMRERRWFVSVSAPVSSFESTY